MTCREGCGRAAHAKGYCRPTYDRIRRYGLSPDEYEELIGRQSNCCAICSIPFGGRIWIHVDHDHETGRVRSLLCRLCNLILGMAYDDPDILQMASNYLRDHGSTGKYLYGHVDN